MPSPAAAFHAAQEAALRASAALAVAMGGAVRVYTEVPTNAPLPYVVIGQDDVDHIRNDDCAAEAVITSTVQWWSRVTPLDHQAQVRGMGAAIMAALNTELTLDGWEVIEAEAFEGPYGSDPDKSSRGRAVCTYQLTEIVA